MMNTGAKSVRSCLARLQGTNWAWSQTLGFNSSSTSGEHEDSTSRFSDSFHSRNFGQPLFGSERVKLPPGFSHPGQHRTLHYTCVARGEDPDLPAKQLSAEDLDRIKSSMELLAKETQKNVSLGRMDIAEEIMAKGGQAMASVLGKESMQWIEIQVMLSTLLHVSASHERCIEVCEAVLPVIDKVLSSPMRDDMSAGALLRLGAAEIGQGNLQEAALTLDAATECIEAHPDKGWVIGLLQELTFYMVLVGLYGSNTVEGIRELEKPLLAACSGLKDVLGPTNGLSLAALDAYSKLLHRTIDSGRIELANEIFSQTALVHRALGYEKYQLSLVQYQHGTWLYSHGEYELSRERLQESLDLLTNNPLTEVDLNRDPELEETRQHELMLRRHRIAVITCVMIHEGIPVEDDASKEAHATLAMCSAYYEELMGSDNALTAEARFALALLGLADRLDSDPKDAKTIQTNMANSMKIMARSLPNGLDHLLVKKLRMLYEQRFGELVLSDEELEQLRDMQQLQEREFQQLRERDQ